MRRRFRTLARRGTLGALLCGSLPAGAAAEGLELQTLSPAPAGDRFHLTEDGAAGGDGTLAARLLGSYAYKPLLQRNGTEVVSSQLYMDAGVSYALSHRWLFALDVPWVMAQDGVASTDGAHLSDLRLASRVGILRTPSFSLGGGVAALLPTGSPEALTGDDTVRVRMLASGSGRVSSFVYAANVGYLARTERDLAGASVGPSLPFSVAGGLMLLDDALAVSAEVSGLTVLSGSASTPLFGLVAARYRIGSVVLGAGVGPGLSSAPGVSPRGLLSLAWEPAEPATPPPEAEPVEPPPGPPPPAPLPSEPASEPAAAPPPPAPPALAAPDPAPAPAVPPPAPEPPLPPPAPPRPALTEAEARAEARRLFNEGVTAFDDGRFGDAAEAFAKAMALRPHPTVLRNLAQSELMAGRKELACQHFKDWKQQVEKASPAEVAQVNQGLKQACR